jgi:AcrR family transcriptional regulator
MAKPHLIGGPLAGKKALGRPPGATSEATRARILAAARVCFARTGFAATTNKEIAEQAGVTAAAIYLYFDSKTALYMAVVRDANEALLAEYRRVLAGAKTVREGFRAFLDESVRLHQRDPSLTAFLSGVAVEMQRNEDVRRAMTAEPSEIVTLVAHLVEQGVKRGELKRSAAPRVVQMFVAVTMGFSLYAAAIETDELDALAETFGALLDGNLFAKR